MILLKGLGRMFSVILTIIGTTLLMILRMFIGIFESIGVVVMHLWVGLLALLFVLFLVTGQLEKVFLNHLWFNVIGLVLVTGIISFMNVICLFGDDLCDFLQERLFRLTGYFNNRDDDVYMYNDNLSYDDSNSVKRKEEVVIHVVHHNGDNNMEIVKEQNVKNIDVSDIVDAEFLEETV